MDAADVNSSLPINVAAHSLEMMLQARVITDAKGTPQTIVLVGPHGVELKFPGMAYPFVENGRQVLAIVSVVQVKELEVAPLAPSKLLIPGKS